MAELLVLGAGTGGLMAALAVARAGHRVTVIEKDAAPPESAAEALAWARPGTPQALLPHAFMGGARRLLCERAPDVLDALLAAGALDFDLASSLPGGARLAADAELRVLFCRRPLLESTLWRLVAREPRVRLISGTGAEGLVVAGGRVAGLRVEGQALGADLVVDAAGRRSPVPRWLAEAGFALPAERVEECGLVYYARYYAVRNGAAPPTPRWLWGPRAELSCALAMVHLADRGIHSMTLALATHERDLRAIRDPDVFERVAGALPAFAPWVDARTVTPVTPVLAMGGLQDVLRPFAEGGRLLAPGLVPLGDSLCHTNAAFGWGMAMGFTQAWALADAVASHRGFDDVAADYHARVWPEAADRWGVAAEQDLLRLRLWRGEPVGIGELPHATLLRELAPAAATDAEVFRAVFRFQTLLEPAAAIFANADRLRERCRLAPPLPVAPPPSREALLAAMRGG